MDTSGSSTTARGTGLAIGGLVALAACGLIGYQFGAATAGPNATATQPTGSILVAIMALAGLAILAAVLVILAALAWSEALRRFAHARDMTKDVIRLSARRGRRWALWLDREERDLDRLEERYG